MSLIFQPLESDAVVLGRVQSVSQPLWSDGNSSMTDFAIKTAELATGSQNRPLRGAYYVDVYNSGSTEEMQPQMSLTFGNFYGSGSTLVESSSASGSGTSATKAVYNEFRNLILAPTDRKFTFLTSSGDSNGVDADSVYVISFKSNRLKDRINEGSVEFTLKVTSSSPPFLFSQSFIDDSVVAKASQTLVSNQSNKVYNITKGTLDTQESLASSSYYDSQGRGIGLMYPDAGIIVLNAAAIADIMGVGIGGINGYQLSGSMDTSANQQNFLRLWTALDLGSQMEGFYARSTEYIPAEHVFVRVKNQDFNYSNNPTFVLSRTEANALAAQSNLPSSEYTGRIRFPEFYNDPRVYITTIGLYNDSNELVAVAKSSNPILKTFDSELVAKIRISF